MVSNDYLVGSFKTFLSSDNKIANVQWESSIEEKSFYRYSLIILREERMHFVYFKTYYS